MSRSNRNWPNGIRTCSKCGATFKQLQSLSNHVARCTATKTTGLPPHPGYPPHFQKLLDAHAAEEVNMKVR